jgi:putative tryptophan/tyrosine transport system substrate-binding protein
MITHVRSWRHRFAVAAVLALSAFVCGPAWGQAAPYNKWFKYDPDIGKEWDVAGDPTNPLAVSIKRKDGVGPVRRVLVMYPRASSAYDTAITEILRTFSAKEINASVDVINFELNDAKGKASLGIAEQNRTELVFGMGSESAAWLYQNYMKGKLPVVTVCAKDPVQLGQMKDYDSGSGNNFAFTSLNVPVDVQMSYVRELRPDLKNITVLVDSKNISAVQTQAEPVANYLKEKGVQVIIGSVQNPANARQELVKIVGDSVRKMRQTDPDLSKSLFWITGSTSVFREIRTINEHADRVPVVSVVPEIVTKGTDTAVLAIGVSFESNARLAGIYGAQILNGAKVEQLKVGLVSPPDIAISFLKARDIGMRVPFSFFEIASYIYDYNGAAVRSADAKATN